MASKTTSSLHRPGVGIPLFVYYMICPSLFALAASFSLGHVRFSACGIFVSLEFLADICSPQLPDNDAEDSPTITPPSAPPPPPPLNVPSRARRQLQARLALHSRQQAEKDAAEEAGTSSPSDPSAPNSEDHNAVSKHYQPSSFDGADEPEHWDDVQNDVEGPEDVDEDDEEDEEEEPEPEGLTMASSSSAKVRIPGKRRMSSTSVAKVRSAIEDEDDESHIVSSAEK